MAAWLEMQVESVGNIGGHEAGRNDWEAKSRGVSYVPQGPIYENMLPSTQITSNYNQGNR